MRSWVALGVLMGLGVAPGCAGPAQPGSSHDSAGQRKKSKERKAVPADAGASCDSGGDADADAGDGCGDATVEDATPWTGAWEAGGPIDASAGGYGGWDATAPPPEPTASGGTATGPPEPPPEDPPVIPSVPVGAAKIKTGDSVFFVGNSFFGGDDDRLAGLVAGLGARVSPAITIRTGSHVVYGTQLLGWFFQQPESQNAIQSGSYDVFVLQGMEREPVERPTEFKQAVRDYHQAVTAKGGTIMLFMTWDFIWEKDTAFFQNLSAAYEQVGAELGVPVIPVGVIYQDCDGDPYSNESPYWLTSQGLHQNAKGTAVNAYATFAMLTGVNPQGAAFGAPLFDLGDPPLLRYLSDKAWARVAPRLAP